MKINIDQNFLFEIFLKGENKACVEIYKYSFEPVLGLSNEFGLSWEELYFVGIKR